MPDQSGALWWQSCYIEGSITGYLIVGREEGEEVPPGPWEFILRPGSVTHIDDAVFRMKPDASKTLYIRKLCMSKPKVEWKIGDQRDNVQIWELKEYKTGTPYFYISQFSIEDDPWYRLTVDEMRELYEQLKSYFEYKTQEEVEAEMIAKMKAQQEEKQATYKLLKEKGLPIPEDLYE